MPFHTSARAFYLCALPIWEWRWISGHRRRPPLPQCLGRVEFLLALLNIAMLRYVEPKKIPDVSEAFHRLLGTDIRQLLNPRVFQRPNPFRSKFCYVKEIDKV